MSDVVNEMNETPEVKKSAESVKSAKKTNPAFVIMKRELASYFTSPVAYIVCALFLIASSLLFFMPFFIYKRADLRSFFQLLPILFSFFIPAMTMRIFSEEKRSGSIETLMTLPVTSTQVVWGKYLAALISCAVLLVPTIFYVITVCAFGKPEAGPIIGGYLGALFLIADYCAIGVWASSVTKNQLLAFFTAFAICIVLTLIGMFAIFMPGVMVNVAAFISSASHFESISRGIIDSRDVIYFVSVTAVFFVFTVHSVNNQKKGK